MADRESGHGRYARVEREHRWVLSERPPEAVRSAVIHDRYIDGTTLRLRRVERDGVVVFKLGQKVRDTPGEPEVVRLTSMYLSASEYDVFAALPAATIDKTRWVIAGQRFAIDEFHGELEGLVLAEVELHPDESTVAPPPLAVQDVTHDDRFSGGTLARTPPRSVSSRS
jgi:adenylate cyclase